MILLQPLIINMKRDGSRISCWQEENTFEPRSYAINESDVFDVIIAGGGITGLTTGVLLQNAGLKCLISEAHNIGFGTTGGTTAHLNTFLDTPYNTVIKNFNEEDARLIYNGAASAIDLIRSNISDYNIDCSFREMTGFLFSTEEKQNDEMESIRAAAKKTGMDIGYTNTSPVPIPYSKILSFTGQAQFNPVRYIIGLAKAFEEAGGIILHHNPVTDANENDIVEVQTKAGILRAKNLVYATHIPAGVSILHLRAAPYRSYAMAVVLSDDKYPDALAYDMEDPYHYYRSQEIQGKKYLIAGGEDHKTGHAENAETRFRDLEAHVRKYFEVKEIAYKWSSQYFEPVDGLPYIGNYPGHTDNVYVATGFGGNGMIYGTLSGVILHDLILSGNSDFKKLLSPGRLKPVAGFKNFVTENVDAAAQFIEGKLSADKVSSFSELAAGEGRVVKYEGKNLGIYKDEVGKIYAVSPDCPHIHCSVKWNNAETSWDCPCHGSRFDINGEMLTGPSQKPLKKLDLS
jgi:glycine/D-amino acid oxidase-like deaminating enzyme/nitrite reductase/ring-hydroxylating ferredoxin subunit